MKNHHERSVRAPRMSTRTIEVELDAEAPFDLRTLPPLPRPMFKPLLWQKLGGFALIALISGAGVGVVQGILAAGFPSEVYWACCGVVYGQVGFTLVCWARVCFGNPGRIRRGRSTCLPLPPAVQAHLEACRRGEAPAPLANVLEGKRSYCVRCYVWRPEPRPQKRCCPLPGGATLPWCDADLEAEVPAHHCSTCGRCSAGFDHHCDLLGACIAADNLRWFKALLVMAVVGPITAFVVLPTALGCVALTLSGLWWAGLLVVLAVVGCLALCSRARWGGAYHCMSVVGAFSDRCDAALSWVHPGF